MSKSDGTKIVIQFDDSILSGIEGSESTFEVLVPEYEYVPNGPMVTKTKSVDSVESIHSFNNRILLNMKPLEKFNNAAGPITVVYSGGYLMGEGGPVEPFEETFTPTDLIMKPHQKVRERLQVNDINVIGSVIPVNFIESIHREKVIINNINVIAQITNIDDI